MLLNWGKSRIDIVTGDVTDQDVDAIVNAANSTLIGGGGVDGAIHRRGGPRILEECKIIRRDQWPDGLPGGRAVITTGGLLKARFVIHTIGPVWRGGGLGEERTLAECYWNSLELAKKWKLRSVAFPSISTGAYGYPIGEAAKVALMAVRKFVDEHGWPPEISLISFSSSDFKIYEQRATELG